jgi:DNA-binding response OmpR family regulator
MARVLIVEDEEPQRIIYETEISDMGHQVILARDGAEAIDVARKQRPDVVILDLMIPKTHGLEALKKILGNDPNVPVIIHTAYNHYKDDFMSWAAEEYIVKSSDLTELKSAIKRVLSGRGKK